MATWLRSLSAVLVPLVLAGCASMKSHNETANLVQQASSGGDFTAALKELDARNSSAEEKKQVLYNMERGELLRLNSQIPESNQALLAADARIKQWEDTAKSSPEKLIGQVGASLISERIKAYEGQDYEKVWLTTRLALNRISLGDFDGARVDIKRTHEREAIIAEFRSKETSAAESEAASRGVAPRGREINGYPVQTLNDPEVLRLKNGYQNALSHYLAGFVYEALGEASLAAPGYRQAIELRPGVRALEEGLRGLDDRSSPAAKQAQQMTDVLFVIEVGEAPARVPRNFVLPVPTGRSMVAVPISYPVIMPSAEPVLSRLDVAGRTLTVDRVVDLNVMARRALRDEMPGMVARGIVRAVAKAVVQEELQKRAGAFAGLIGAVAAAATEQADDRIWRMLPGHVYVSRGYLPPGEHEITLNGQGIGKVTVSGQYAMVPVRLYRSVRWIGDVGTLGKLSTPQTTAQTATK